MRSPSELKVEIGQGFWYVFEVLEEAMEEHSGRDAKVGGTVGIGSP